MSNKLLCVLPVFGYQLLAEKFIADTDACDVGIDGTLLPVQEREEWKKATSAKRL
jgi:hypothetical protein